MIRRAYYRLALTMPADWLRACVADPSPYMTRWHVALARLALRDMGGAK